MNKEVQLKALHAIDAKARRRRSVRQTSRDHKFIGLGNDKAAIVDCEDYEWLSQSIWRLNDSGYAIRERAPRRMHRAIMESNIGRALLRREQIDHIDGNRLNNRRDNLRIATNQQNGFNSKPRNGTSRYKGVHWNTQKDKWHANISLGNRMLHMGFFDDEQEAAIAYDRAALQLYGDYAWLNLIGR